MKKGFTLVELLAVIVIVGLLALLILPNIMNQINSQRIEVDKLTKELISVATEQYMDIRSNDFEYKDKDIYCITLQSLVDSKLLQVPIMDSNNEEIALSNFVKVNVSYGESPKPNFDIEITSECEGYIAPEEPDIVEIVYEFDYTGNYQTFTAEESGLYKFEAWGASGGSANNIEGGTGSYTSGFVTLEKGDIIYIYVGEKGYADSILYASTTPLRGTFNGNNGMNRRWTQSTTAIQIGSAGGGATDFRLVSGDWNNATSLNSRIMTSAGGGGSLYAKLDNGDVIAETTNSADGGGLIGYNPIISGSNTIYNAAMTTPTQTSGGISNYNNEGNKTSLFGVGNTGATAGAGGYYGGITSFFGGGSGSSYISGHTGAVAISSASNQTPKSGCTTGTPDNDCSIHYSNLTFSNTTMIDGAGYNWTKEKGNLVNMPNPNGGTYASEIGHSGDGYAKITYYKETVTPNEIVYEFDYTGNYQTFTAEESGNHKFEAWGASAVSSNGKGAYTSGNLELTKGDVIYIYVGEGNNGTTNGTSFNGGTGDYGGAAGGGATDFRLVSGDWYDFDSLKSRIMVAAGAGAGGLNNGTAYSHGGILTGIGTPSGGQGATQTAPGNLETNAPYALSRFGVGNGGCAGGGGYYGGGGSTCTSGGGGGGSSFISGMSGMNAISASSTSTNIIHTGQTNHYSGKVFTSIVAAAGNETMKSPNGDIQTGHSGNGYAKITYLGN